MTGDEGWDDPATSDRWDLLEITFTLVVTMIGLAIFGTILPTVIVVRETGSAVAQVTVPLLAASAVPYVLSIPVGVYLVERRLVRPFGPHRQVRRQKSRYVDRLIPVVVMLVAWDLGRLWWPIESYLEPGNGPVMWVGVPAAAAQGLILGLAGYGVAFIAISLRKGRAAAVASNPDQAESVATPAEG